MTDNFDLEQAYCSISGLPSSMATNLIGPNPMATVARRVPCWCRGKERQPLETLPIFQYLKTQEQSSSQQPSHSSAPASALRGLGRGRPLDSAALSFGAMDSDSGEEEGDGDVSHLKYVQSYWKQQRPLSTPTANFSMCSTRESMPFLLTLLYSLPPSSL